MDHVLINTVPATPQRSKTTDPKQLVFKFCKMLAEIGRGLHRRPAAEASRSGLRRLLYKMAVEESASGSGNNNRSILQRCLDGGS
jgi:hypothetical protein